MMQRNLVCIGSVVAAAIWELEGEKGVWLVGACAGVMGEEI